MEKERKLLEVKKWTIELNIFEDGTHMIRTNEGFNALELLGLASLLQHDVIQQIKGEIKPDVIKRQVLED